MLKEGLEKDKTQEELKIDQFNLAEASTHVHLFTRQCTILGYSMNLLLCCAVVMKAVSLINFTDSFYANGLPKVNLFKTSHILFFGFGLWSLIHISLNANLHSVVGKGLSRIAPTFRFHYLQLALIFSIVLSLELFIFTYSMEELGLDIGLGENVQILIGIIIFVGFVVYSILFVRNKMKSFKGKKIDKDNNDSILKVDRKENVISFMVVLVVVIFSSYYVALGIVVYRVSSSAWRVVIALLIHPIIVELLTTLLKCQYGEINFKTKVHPFYDSFMTFALECILNLFRRFMFNDTNNVNLTFLLVVLSGFQEVLIRSTMERKESLMRRVIGSPPIAKEIKVLKRKYYSYTVTARSILELVCILISPIMFTFFFSNRYAIDLGYTSIISLDYDSMISSTVLQLVVELMVIYCCSMIELKNGIPMSDFFHQFRDFRVFLSHLTAFLVACSWILYNFKTVPNRLVCSTANDPCSCPSFSVYQQLCANLTSSNSTVSVNIESSNSSFAFGSNISIVILSLLGLFCIIAVTYYFASKRKNDKYRVKMERRQKNLRKTVLDAKTADLMEQSALQQAISTIESMCRGVSPSQARQLQYVIETLKSQAKVSNVINIEKMFIDEEDQDEKIKDWLKEQLMPHEQKQSTNKNLLKSDDLFNIRKLSTAMKATSGRLKFPLDRNDNMYVSSNDSNSDSLSMESLHLEPLQCDINIPHIMQGNSNDDNLDILNWDFNVFAIENKYPQSWLAWRAFTILSTYQVDFFVELNIPRLQLTNMLIFVEQNYSLMNYDSYSGYSFNGVEAKSIESSKPQMERLLSKNLEDGVKESKGNLYHNNLHGADVFQGVLYFATKYDDIGSHLGQLDFFALLFAAYIHDFNHPGLNTTYMNSDWPSSGISSTFGTDSPLEKHHLAMAFNLMRNDNQYNFLLNFSSDKLDHFRRIVTECVLATDLAKSMPWISSAKIAFKDLKTEIRNPLDEISQDQKSKDEKKESEYKLLLMQLSIKCADVGHPCRSLDQHLEWSRRIRDEFYCQGDKEKLNGRKISPLCDRNVSLSNYPQGQIGFINYVSKPCFMLLNEVCWLVADREDEKPWLKYMNSNIQYWEDKKKEAM